MRRFIEPLSLTLGGLLVGWLLLEIILRWTATALPYTITAPMRDVNRHPFTAATILPEQIWIDDDSYQLITPPGIDNEFQYPDPRIGLNVSTQNWLDPNSQVGFRVPSIDWEPIWPVDVVVVGDSFSFCYVEYADCWVDLLASKHNYSMVNLGLVATGSISHQNVLNTFGLPHDPQLVIWQWYGNDFNDDYGFTTLYGENAEERKGEDSVPPGWLRRNSAVASIVHAISQSRQGSQQFTRFIDPYMVNIGNENIWFGRPYIQEAFSLQEAKNQQGFALSQKAILDTQTRLASKGVELVVLLIPSKEEVYETWTADEMGPDLLDEIAQGRQEMLLFCESNSLTCLDTTSTLKDQANVGNLVYHAQDTHLNKLGNQVLAEFVKKNLDSMLTK
ncbi:MAG: hypothetical protein AAF902_00240 [Chloroflexota bacterium]